MRDFNNLVKMVKHVNFKSKEGRFLGDKSYAYDTIFFMSKFILANLDDKNRYNSSINRKNAEIYISDIFQLDLKKDGVYNYMNETLNVLQFANIIKKDSKNTFLVEDKDILYYIVERIENAYIFLYLIVYFCFTNDGILNKYKEFLLSTDLNLKKNKLEQIGDLIIEKSISVENKEKPYSVWAMLLVKYAMNVLNYANNSNEIARTWNVKKKKSDIRTVSINVDGTKTPKSRPKKNKYIDTINKNYILTVLKKYLLIEVQFSDDYSSSENEADDLANLKIDIIKWSTSEPSPMVFNEPKYIDSYIKARNTNVQRKFRNSLLSNYEHKCAICDFSIKEFLIAAHIVPYTECDDTYDSINHYNGFLLCPNHDKLFEAAENMTIIYNTGEIVLSEKFIQSEEYGHLHGQIIDYKLINNERRHYLKKHNETFNNKNNK